MTRTKRMPATSLARIPPGGGPCFRWNGVRSKVEIVMIRAADVQQGDVVNRRGPIRDQWIEVAQLEQLESGSYVVHDETGKDSFTAVGYDLIWLQVLHELRENSHLPVPS